MYKDTELIEKYIQNGSWGKIIKHLNSMIESNLFKTDGIAREELAKNLKRVKEHLDLGTIPFWKTDIRRKLLLTVQQGEMALKYSRPQLL